MGHENGNTQLLTSWKEIAAHLGKGVRTVQRWERELGLPVRRPSRGRHIVVALAAELDGWIAHLSQPSSAPCCSCRDELERAGQTIVHLREQIATLESEMKAAMLALQVDRKVTIVAAASSRILPINRIESEGNAA
jgi:hypothetical protein